MNRPLLILWAVIVLGILGWVAYDMIKVVVNYLATARPKYRIKTIKYADEEKFWNTFGATEVPEVKEYLVQVKRFGMWYTIKRFSDTDEWWAEANAKNLLDELNKTL